MVWQRFAYSKKRYFLEERNNGSLAVKRNLETRGKLCKYFDTITAQNMRGVFQEKKNQNSGSIICKRNRSFENEINEIWTLDVSHAKGEKNNSQKFK